MLDKNGIELKTGQIVRVEGGYFKNDNGIFRIKHAPGNENWSGKYYSLTKVNKKDFSDSKSKYNLSSFPLVSYISNREKSKDAYEHNKKHATIEVIGTIPTYKIKTIDNSWNREKEHILYCNEIELNEMQKQESVRIEIIELYR